MGQGRIKSPAKFHARVRPNTKRSLELLLFARKRKWDMPCEARNIASRVPHMLLVLLAYHASFFEAVCTTTHGIWQAAGRIMRTTIAGLLYIACAYALVHLSASVDLYAPYWTAIVDYFPS